MNLRKITLLLFLLMMSFLTRAQSLSEIVSYSATICDDIIKDIGTKSEITRTLVQGKVEASLPKLAKIIGAKLGGEGELLYDSTVTIGIPFEKLPDQLSSARDCRERLTVLFIEERRKTCGVELYYSKRSEVCGVESYKKARTIECGIESTTTSASSGGCSSCGSKCEQWGGKSGECSEEKHRSLKGLKVKEWKSCSMYCSKHRECEHHTHGIAQYKECRHQNHGVEKYKTCG